MRTFLFAAVIAAATPIAAQAQVIEIDSSGTAQTYDGPTLFTVADAFPIVIEVTQTLSEDPISLIEQAARVHRLDPTLLKAVAWQESRGRMSAVSNKGARGVMQLMPGTALELGVDARSMSGNIRGGAMYLRQQLDRFGSVPLALAAYNAGPGAVIRYRGIPPYRETRDYVAKIMGRWRPTVASNPIQSFIVEVVK
ncbi:lytic transglycosylase domain-containing protein [Sphingomonas sp.]|uniref:lytic transglycosylase domain-containing protein n=1 Tax=Sphingomonas sp. TaxID=28214 RepID=UPI00286B93E5|nr:lytic transglycosylase domain-containing protein [Sphingomonas sp.]